MFFFYFIKIENLLVWKILSLMLLIYDHNFVFLFYYINDEKTSHFRSQIQNKYISISNYRNLIYLIKLYLIGSL